MTIPNKMSMTEEQAFSLIEQFPFATLVSADLQSTHLPLIFDSQKQRLLGHVAKANPHWQALNGTKVLCLFNGPHAYISPLWYTKRPAVPTWNYSVVHVRGTLSLVDTNETLRIVKQLTQAFEPKLVVGNDKDNQGESLALDSSVMDKAYVDRLSKAIVGFTINIEQIEGKHKLGQHKSNEDQVGVFNGLKASSTVESQQLANWMKSVELGTGK